MALATAAVAGCGSAKTRTVTVTTSATQPTPAQSTPTPTQATTSPQPVVLGSSSFAPSGAGFGTGQPSEIFNGGDPSGHVSQIQWTGWGSPVAYGRGLSSIFRPQGGYYPQLVAVELRAADLGSCAPGGAPAYRRLSVREPSAPGGPLGAWTPWSRTGNICSPP